LVYYFGTPVAPGGGGGSGGSGGSSSALTATISKVHGSSQKFTITSPSAFASTDSL